MDEGISLGLVMALVEEATGADPAVIEQAVQDWLDAHPEATTTVADGSITEQKLAAAVAAKINQVSQLSDEIAQTKDALSETNNILLNTYSELWAVGTKGAMYTSSTFSGFATSWDITDSAYLKAIHFWVRSRAQANITEIRVRIESGDFAVERSISVDVGSTMTECVFPVGAVVPAGTVWIGIAANQIATFYHANDSTNYDYKYWTSGNMSDLANLKSSNGSSKRLYITADIYSDLYIKNGTITQNKLSFAERVIPENLFNCKDETQFKKHWWWYSTAVGSKITMQEVAQYTYTALTIETFGAEKITIGTFPAEAYPPTVYWIGAADENMILLSYEITNRRAPVTFTMPENAKYVLISYATLSDDILAHTMVVNGETITRYIPSKGVQYLLKGCVIEEQDETANSVSLKLPEKYDLVVGDTFQMFKKGLFNAINTDDFDVIFQCDQGAGYERMFEITPTEAGTVQVGITLYDANRKAVDISGVSLVVHPKASSPATQKNILCVGDSLTTGGTWPHEFERRLTASDGTPAGDGLTNINFIGTRVYGGTHYEGYGGWSFTSYNTANVNSNTKIITCAHDKTEAEDQHSIYKDANNATWKLETIESGQIKIIAVSGEGRDFPATGTLTWVSGGTNHADIVYTASQNAPGNPFWDSINSKVDFAKYATAQGVSSIDYVYVLLGWNSVGSSEETYKANAQTFIDNVHASFPNAKIVLMGLQIPARDGLGNNYGATSIYGNYPRVMDFTFNLNDWYSDLAENNENVYFVNLCGQFDTEHNMPTTTRRVNTRNSETEAYQSNGVHPATPGYMQIADAAYRHITGIL